MTAHPTLTVSELIAALAGRTDLADCKVLIDVSPWDEALNLTGLISYADHPPIDADHEGFIVLSPSIEGATRLDPDSDAVAPMAASTTAFDMPAAIEAVRAGIRALALAEATGNLPELTANSTNEGNPMSLLSPRVLGQIMMDHLFLGDTSDARMPIEDKLYWTEVAEWMGPDWIESFRRAGAFMTKVEGF